VHSRKVLPEPEAHNVVLIYYTSLHFKTTHVGLLHHTLCLIISQLLLIFDLPTLEGWKAEFTWVVGWLCVEMVDL